MLTNLSDFENLARKKLSLDVYDYYAGGANDEVTLQRNLDAFNKILLAPRVLQNMNACNTEIKFFGLDLSMPVIIAPIAFQALANQDGEVATAKAAATVGIPAIISTMSTVALEEVIAKVNTPLWFQLYIYKDRQVTFDLIHRAEVAGYKAIVLTVDVPVMGNRERDIRNQFKLPPHLGAANLRSRGMQNVSNDNDGSAIKNYTNEKFDRSLTWSDITWLKSITKLPIILKGIMCVDDANKAIDYGVSAIVISNHGGRQLDSAPATIEILPAIADSIKGKIPILIDSGFRRGVDIFKALALGADCILLGRPILWGLAVAGQEGVEKVLGILKAELLESMILCGCSTIGEIRDNSSSLLWFSKY